MVDVDVDVDVEVEEVELVEVELVEVEEVDVEVVPGAFHAFDGVAPRSASARGFLGSFDRALAHRLAG